MLWIAVLAALGLSLYAFTLHPPRAAWAAVLAAVIYLPFTLYLAASPGTRWLGPGVQVLYFLAAYTVHRGWRGPAALLTLPAFGLAAYVAVLILGFNASLR
jgi:hypothetical protein